MSDTVMVTQFQIGDVVRLRSDGPAMTVVHFFDPRGMICCEWFAGQQVMQKNFAAETLDLVDRAPERNPTA